MRKKKQRSLARQFRVKLQDQREGVGLLAFGAGNNPFLRHVPGFIPVLTGQKFVEHLIHGISLGGKRGPSFRVRIKPFALGRQGRRNRNRIGPDDQGLGLRRGRASA